MEVTKMLKEQVQIYLRSQRSHARKWNKDLQNYIKGLGEDDKNNLYQKKGQNEDHRCGGYLNM